MGPFNDFTPFIVNFSHKTSKKDSSLPYFLKNSFVNKDLARLTKSSNNFSSLTLMTSCNAHRKKYRYCNRSLRCRNLRNHDKNDLGKKFTITGVLPKKVHYNRSHFAYSDLRLW